MRAQITTDTKYKYNAFISYRHLEPDLSTARKLYSLLASYPDAENPDLKIFIDFSELPSASLSEKIDLALEQSQYLIIVCSKRTPESKWCRQEVTKFISSGKANNIIPVLIEGTPEESFPQELFEVFKSDENDVLYIDLRVKAYDSRDFDYYENHDQNTLKKIKRILLKKIFNEKDKVIASLLGLNLGDVINRIEKQKFKRFRRTFSIIGAILIFSIVIISKAFISERNTRKELENINANLVLDNALEFLEKGDKFQALNSIREDKDILIDLAADDSTIKTKLTRLLNDAFSSTGLFDYSLETNSINPQAIILGDTNLLIYSYNDIAIRIIDLETNTLLEDFQAHDQPVLYLGSVDNETFISIGADKTIKKWQAKNGELLYEQAFTGNYKNAKLSENAIVLEYVNFENSDQITYSLDDLSILPNKSEFPENDEYSLVETGESNTSYYRFNILLHRFDKQSNKLLSSIFILDEFVQNIHVSQNDRLFLKTDESILVIEDNIIINKINTDTIDFSNASILYSVNGSKIVVLDGHQRKILVHNVDNAHEVIPELLVDISNDSKYGLVEKDDVLEVWDLSNYKLMSSVKKDIFSENIGPLYRISNDGHYLLIGQQLSSSLNIYPCSFIVYDLYTESIVMDKQGNYGVAGFLNAPDQFFCEDTEGIVIYSIENSTDEPLMTIPLVKRINYNIIHSDNDKYLGVNYLDGTSAIVNTRTRKIQKEISGWLIFISENNNVLTYIVCKDNYINTYANQNLIHSVKVEPSVILNASDVSLDYYPENELLLVRLQKKATQIHDMGMRINTFFLDVKSGKIRYLYKNNFSQDLNYDPVDLNFDSLNQTLFKKLPTLTVYQGENYSLDNYDSEYDGYNFHVPESDSIQQYQQFKIKLYDFPELLNLLEQYYVDYPNLEEGPESNDQQP